MGVRDKEDKELTDIVVTYPRNGARAFSWGRPSVDHSIAGRSPPVFDPFRLLWTVTNVCIVLKTVQQL